VCRSAAGVCDPVETCNGVERRLPGRREELGGLPLVGRCVRPGREL
jgi:hypothetical protein